MTLIEGEKVAFYNEREAVPLNGQIRTMTRIGQHLVRIEGVLEMCARCARRTFICAWRTASGHCAATRVNVTRFVRYLLYAEWTP